MKIKLFLLLVLTNLTLVFGQVGKFNAYSLSTKTYNGYKWSDWSTPQEVYILTSINLDDLKIKIYSKETQIYDIISIEPKEIDDDGDEIYRMYCEDKDGINCNVDLYILHSRNKRLQIYIRYSDMQWVYNLERAD